jgi:hypothetical protein
VIKIAILILMSLTVQANELKGLSSSIFKIAEYDKKSRLSGVATAFAVRYNGETYMVTNNHVCDSFYRSTAAILFKSGNDYTKSAVLRKAITNDGDVVKTYYMHKGSDICIFKSEKMSEYTPLAISKDSLDPSDKILVAGFVGRAKDLMFVDGRVYGSVSIKHPGALLDCSSNPPQGNDTASNIICQAFKSYPEYILKSLKNATANIGPGFSGSPVLVGTTVRGIISRYYRPASGYSNGDAIFFESKDIIEAINASTKKMVKFSSDEFKNYIMVTKAHGNLVEIIEEAKKMIAESLESILSGDGDDE